MFASSCDVPVYRIDAVVEAPNVIVKRVVPGTGAPAARFSRCTSFTPTVGLLKTCTEPRAPPIDGKPFSAACTWSAVALKPSVGVVDVTAVIGFLNVNVNVPVLPVTRTDSTAETPSNIGVQVWPPLTVFHAPPPAVEMYMMLASFRSVCTLVTRPATLPTGPTALKIWALLIGAGPTGNHCVG